MATTGKKKTEDWLIVGGLKTADELGLSGTSIITVASSPARSKTPSSATPQAPSTPTVAKPASKPR